MQIDLFDYKLPKELIAQVPAKRRDQSRLLVLDRNSGETIIRPFKSIIEYLKSGDALVINNTRVFKSRLIGHRKSGAEVEIFLLPSTPAITNSEALNRQGVALVRPSRRLKEGEEINFDEKNHVTLIKNFGGGKWLVEFESAKSKRAIVHKFGHVPLPQYISREDEQYDSQRYQTVFARKDKANAVAAPTAGLHFTESLLEKLKTKGVKVVEVTLDVGPGTFKPVTVDEIERHTVDPEWATLSVKAAKTLNRARKNRGRIFAAGTTSVRTLESARIKNNEIQSFEKEVDLYIKPGYKFELIDCMLTNFHLPKSSLLILVSAFAGREKILSAYEKAIKERMRFYSYGDAMLII